MTCAVGPRWRRPRPDMALGLAGLRRHPVLLAGPGYAEVLERLERFFEVEADETAAALDLAALAARLRGKSALIAARTSGIDAALLAQVPHLRAVCKMRPDHADIDLAACTRAGVMVTNTPDLGNDGQAHRQMALIAADNLIAAFGFGRIGGHPVNLVNLELRCLLGCCI